MRKTSVREKRKIKNSMNMNMIQNIIRI